MLLVILIWSGCTTEKDGFSYRVFHNTTARYNGYFYAGESLKEADGILKEEHQDDYDEILPVFIYGDEETSQSVYPQMERIIEKTTRVIERHDMVTSKKNSKSSKKPLKNKWIDENWMLMGQAYFYKQNYYKAEEIFRYVTRKYKEPEQQLKAFTWLGRVYIEQEEWIKANNNITKATQMKKNVEDEMKSDTYLVLADYNLRQENYKEAAENLERALKRIPKKKDRARPTFILAQIMQEMSKSQDAIDYYRTVLKLRPEYEMEFYAKINQAMAYSRRGGNPGEIKEQLFKMLKDDKNIEYRDQIYFALAELSFEEREREQGIDYLHQSLEANIDNTKQKMKSFLKLADIYFDERVYESAQTYYDSTFQNISEDHPRYQDVKNKATSLNELVSNLEIIYREDSLQSFCDLSENELLQRLNDVQRQIERDIEERRLAEEERLASIEAPDAGGDGGVGMFWVYNDVLRSSGYSFFKDYWGGRKLEDDWRRSRKLNQAFDSGEEEFIDDPDEIEVVSNEEFEEVPSIDDLMVDLPCDPFDMIVSDGKVAEAYYNAGVVYKEKLEDFDNAVEMWERLTTRLDDSEFHPTTYYQLYRAYYTKEQEGYNNPICETCNSAFWAKKISEKYPGSEWDKIIKNPDYMDEKEQREAAERTAYEALYDEYRFRQYITVIQACGDIILLEPDNHLLCKYRMLKAQSIGHMDALTGQRSNYEAALQEIVASCPGTEEAEKAQEILNFMSGEIPVENVIDDQDALADSSEFTYDPSERHYFAIVFAVDGNNGTKVKATIADFNTKNFKSAGLRVTSNLLGKENHIVLVKTFDVLDEGGNYFNTFTSNKGELKDLNKSGYDSFLISKSNYLELFKGKNLEGYISFFSSNYDL
jgi:tetratricopeptide (TPR) repeat protein